MPSAAARLRLHDPACFPPLPRSCPKRPGSRNGPNDRCNALISLSVPTHRCRIVPATQRPADRYALSNRPYAGPRTSPIRNTTTNTWSPLAAASACTARRSLSPPCSQGSSSVSGTSRHLARQLHALRSGIDRSGTENPATHRRPVRHEVVTHSLKEQVVTYGPWSDIRPNWRPRRDSNPRPPD